jgi:hypothetical protein
MPEELDLNSEEHDDLEEFWEEVAKVQQQEVIREFDQVFFCDVIVSRRGGALIELAIEGCLESKTYHVERAIKHLSGSQALLGPRCRDEAWSPMR